MIRLPLRSAVDADKWVSKSKAFWWWPSAIQARHNPISAASYRKMEKNGTKGIFLWVKPSISNQFFSTIHKRSWVCSRIFLNSGWNRLLCCSSSTCKKVFLASDRLFCAIWRFVRRQYPTIMIEGLGQSLIKCKPSRIWVSASSNRFHSYRISPINRLRTPAI